MFSVHAVNSHAILTSTEPSGNRVGGRALQIEKKLSVSQENIHYKLFLVCISSSLIIFVFNEKTYFLD